MFNSRLNKARNELNASNYGTAYKYYEKAISMQHEGYEPEKEFITVLLTDGSSTCLDKIKVVSDTITSENDILWVGEIVAEKNGTLALELLTSFAEKYSNKSIEEKITQGSSEPIVPEVKYNSNTYLKAFEFTFNDLNLNFGHRMFITTDGTEPTTDSLIFNQDTKLTISENTVIKVKVYNLLDECSDTITYEYIIDNTSYNDIMYNLKVALDKYTNTPSGDELGCCSEESKTALKKQIDYMNTLVQENVSYEDIQQQLVELKRLLNALNNSIIVETDKVELQKVIAHSKNFVATMTNSKHKNKLTDQITKLNEMIVKAEVIYKNIRVRQNEIDDINKQLEQLCQAYEKKMKALDIPELTNKQILQLASNAYWSLHRMERSQNYDKKNGDYCLAHPPYDTPDEMMNYLTQYFSSRYANNYMYNTAFVRIFDNKCYLHMLAGEGITYELATGQVSNISRNGNKLVATISNIEYLDDFEYNYTFVYENGGWKVDKDH